MTTPPARSKRGLRIASIATLILLIVSLRAALPTAIERALPWAGAKFGGVVVEVANIDLELRNGFIVIEDLVVGLPTGAEVEPAIVREEALLAIETIEFDITWWDLLSRAVRVERFALERPAIRLLQLQEGGFSLPVPPESEEEEASEEEVGVGVEDAEPGEPWKIYVDRFQLSNPSVSIHSESLQRRVAYFGTNVFGVDEFRMLEAGMGIGDISLEHPQIEIHRGWALEQMSSGVDDDVEAAVADVVEEGGDAAPPLAVDISRIDVTTAEFTVDTRRGPRQIGFHLSVDRFGTESDHTFPFEFAMTVDDGEFKIAGEAGLDPVLFVGKLVWQDFPLPAPVLIIEPGIVPWVHSCDSDGELSIALHTQAGAEPAGTSIKGHFVTKDLDISQPEHHELGVSIERIEIVLDDVFIPMGDTDPESARYVIREISVVKPVFVFTNPPDALDELMAIVQEDGAEATEEAPASEGEAGDVAIPVIRIGTIDVDRARLRFTDRSLDPVHETVVRELDIKSEDFFLSDNTVKNLDIKGLIQKSSHFAISGWQSEDKGDFDIELNRLSLPHFNPYVEPAGWRIYKGSTTFRSKLIVDGERRTTDNEFVFHDLSVKSLNPGSFTKTTGVSLDLALALLREPDGDIDLGFDVDWIGNVIRVNLGDLVTDALQEALTGALAAPLKFAGAFMPGGKAAATFEPIAMEPGSSEIGKHQRKRIEALADLLVKRPSLGLKVDAQITPTDRNAIATQLLSESVVSNNPLPDLTVPARIEGRSVDEGSPRLYKRRIAHALRERAEGDRGKLDAEDEARLDAYVEMQHVPEPRMQSLRSERIEVVREAFVEAGAPEGAIKVAQLEPAEQSGILIELGSLESLQEISN
jgi:hypothetical protein